MATRKTRSKHGYRLPLRVTDVPDELRIQTLLALAARTCNAESTMGNLCLVSKMFSQCTETIRELRMRAVRIALAAHGPQDCQTHTGMITLGPTQMHVGGWHRAMFVHEILEYNYVKHGTERPHFVRRFDLPDSDGTRVHTMWVLHFRNGTQRFYAGDELGDDVTLCRLNATDRVASQGMRLFMQRRFFGSKGTYDSDVIVHDESHPLITPMGHALAYNSQLKEISWAWVPAPASV